MFKPLIETLVCPLSYHPSLPVQAPRPPPSPPSLSMLVGLSLAPGRLPALLLLALIERLVDPYPGPPGKI